MKFLKTICLVLVLSANTLQAQEEFIQPPSRYITSFPFKLLTGGIIILQAQVSHYIDSLNFILDTGSGGISLDSSASIRMGIPTEPSEKTIRGIAGIRKVNFAYNHTLRLPGLSVDSLDFHINDYDLLSSVYGQRIDGIIGYSFLSRYIVHVNYDSAVISVYSKGTIKYPKGGYLLRPIMANIPVAYATIRDEYEVYNRFYFDTGAGMCLLLSSDFVEDSVFLRTKTKWYEAQGQGLGGKTDMQQGVVKQFRLGPYRFRNVPAYIFEDEYNITSYPYLGGLIGNELLKKFNLIINYEKRDIHLMPNSHFREKFDYSYTGLGMYMVDGVIMAVDIMKGSPAAKAGFKPDDIIMAVANNFSNDIQAYKNLMQTPGQKVKILVLRDNAPLVLTLKVKSIL